MPIKSDIYFKIQFNIETILGAFTNSDIYSPFLTLPLLEEYILCITCYVVIISTKCYTKISVDRIQTDVFDRMLTIHDSVCYVPNVSLYECAVCMCRTACLFACLITKFRFNIPSKQTTFSVLLTCVSVSPFWYVTPERLRTRM